MNNKSQWNAFFCLSLSWHAAFEIDGAWVRINGWQFFKQIEAI